MNNLFELETMYPVRKKLSSASIVFAVNDRVEEKVKLPDRVENPGQTEEDVTLNGYGKKILSGVDAKLIIL